MSEPERTWFYLGKRNQPRGPFAAEYMIQQCLAGRLGQNSLCWSAGMDDWRPVFTVPVFVAAIERAKQIQGKIHFYCPCGNEVYAGKALAGKAIGDCGQCGLPLTVPPHSQPYQPPLALPADQPASDPTVPLTVPAASRPRPRSGVVLPTAAAAPPRRWLGRLPAALYLFILLCFFLPFVRLSCSEQPVATFTGMHFVTGTSIEQVSDLEDDLGQLSTGRPGDEEPSRDLEPHVEAILAFAFAAAALILTMIGLAKWVPSAFSLAGFLCLFYLKYHLDGQVRDEAEGLMGLEYLYGFWICLTLFMAACLLQLALPSPRRLAGSCPFLRR